MSVGPRLHLCLPLEAENVAIGIGEIQLLHAILRASCLFCLDPIYPHGHVSPIYVVTVEADGGMMMGRNTGGIGGRRAMPLVVRCVQHEFRAIQPEQYPIEMRRRLLVCADDLEA